jgi:putative restriction endonuclease
MKAVLTHRRGSGYDDVPEERYHFPATYLRQVTAAVGDLVLYYEPRRGPEHLGPNPGRQAYFATARIELVENDPRDEGGHYYAIITDYIDFDEDVPFSFDGTYFESALQKDDGTTNKGQFGRSVRGVPDDEFDRIVSFGFAATIRPDHLMPTGFEEQQAPFIRPTVEVTTNRLFREKAFSRNIQAAYRKTCAFTGLQIINGGGRAEAQAAHIRPVAQQGSDSTRNGLALSSTIHWMFDRGLLSIDDDYRILTAKTAVPDPVRRLLNPTGRLNLPDSELQHPHRSFLRYHRENIFKG